MSMENGCYKLSWRERIGFSCGDLAQNLIYQTVSIWLLFFAAIFIIGRYELSDERMDTINMEIANRR